MIDVIFSKRVLTPRERDTRPVRGDYGPKPVRAVGADDDSYFGDEPAGIEDGPSINLHKFEDDLNRNRLNEIATLVRALTYGEMMELAQAIWKIRPEGTVDQQSLPMMLHLWSMAPVSADAPGRTPAETKMLEGKTAEP